MLRHVQRSDSGYIDRTTLKVELPGEKQGRPKERFMDVMREDMQIVGVREEDAEDRER